MANKQTAVEWILHKIARDKLFYEFFKQEIQQAKAMEKEQIKDAYSDGFECKLDAEQYYNDTYGK